MIVGTHGIVSVEHAERLIDSKMVNINVDRTDNVLFVKDSEVRPTITAKVAHIGTDIQEIGNYVDDSIRDIGNATRSPPRSMNSLSASRMPKTSLNSTPSRGDDPKNSSLAESITGKATPITSLILLRILHVATSSEGRNRCCFASPCSSRFAPPSRAARSPAS